MFSNTFKKGRLSHIRGLIRVAKHSVGRIKDWFLHLSHELVQCLHVAVLAICNHGFFLVLIHNYCPDREKLVNSQKKFSIGDLYLKKLVEPRIHENVIDMAVDVHQLEAAAIPHQALVSA